MHLDCWLRLTFDPFSAIFDYRKNEDDMNFVEAVLNLFMKHQTSNITVFDNLGVKLSEIEARIGILCQLNSWTVAKSNMEKLFVGE